MTQYSIKGLITGDFNKEQDLNILGFKKFRELTLNTRNIQPSWDLPSGTK